MGAAVSDVSSRRRRHVAPPGYAGNGRRRGVSQRPGRAPAAIGFRANQALCALVLVYKHVLDDVIPQDHLGKFLLLRSRRVKRVPTVLSVDEVRRLIEAVDPTRTSRLMLEFMYGTGMRVGEVCSLRVRDIDLGRAQVIVRAAKGE